MNKITLLIIIAAVILAGVIFYTRRNKGAYENYQKENNSYQSTPSSPTPLYTFTPTPSSSAEKLIKEDIAVGTGPEAKNGDTVSVNYIGTLENGVKFDSSYDRKKPIELVLGSGRVIQGWELGLLGMKAGGKRKLIIPPSLGYGSQPYGPIPANSTLIFTVELMAVNPHTQ